MPLKFFKRHAAKSSFKVPGVPRASWRERVAQRSKRKSCTIQGALQEHNSASYAPACKGLQGTPYRASGPRVGPTKPRASDGGGGTAQGDRSLQNKGLSGGREEGAAGERGREKEGGRERMGVRPSQALQGGGAGMGSLPSQDFLQNRMVSGECPTVTGAPAVYPAKPRGSEGLGFAKPRVSTGSPMLRPPMQVLRCWAEGGRAQDIINQN